MTFCKIQLLEREIIAVYLDKAKGRKSYLKVTFSEPDFAAFNISKSLIGQNTACLTGILGLYVTYGITYDLIFYGKTKSDVFCICPNFLGLLLCVEKSAFPYFFLAKFTPRVP